MQENNKINTTDEHSINDSYLIIDKNSNLHKISYRSNLIEEIKKINPNSYKEILESDLINTDNVKSIRIIAGILEENGCEFYQLTRL